MEEKVCDILSWFFIEYTQSSISGKIPELVAKWIAGHGISPSLLTLHRQPSERELSRSLSIQSRDASGSDVSDKEKDTLEENPIVCELVCNLEIT